VTYELSETTPLPVTLANFDVQGKNEDAMIYWNTVQETGVANFEIERSRDAQHWDRIGMVPARGNASKGYAYKFTDENILRELLFQESIYYRLKTNDFNGQFSYSEMRNLKQNEPSSVELYPNPVVDQLSVQIGKELEYSKFLSMTIYDPAGRAVRSQELSPNFTKQNINIGDLEQGTYYVKIMADGGVYWSAIVKQ